MKGSRAMPNRMSQQSVPADASEGSKRCGGLSLYSAFVRSLALKMSPIMAWFTPLRYPILNLTTQPAPGAKPERSVAQHAVKSALRAKRAGSHLHIPRGFACNQRAPGLAHRLIPLTTKSSSGLHAC